jgi:predicted AAA+ superfamily ATPase
MLPLVTDEEFLQRWQLLRPTIGPNSPNWFEGYISTYIERDLRLLSAIEDLVSFRRFMQAAALRNASMLNIAQPAQDAGSPPARQDATFR